LNILIIGGSLGAQALNEIIPQALARIQPQQPMFITHQSGEKHLSALTAHYQAANLTAATCVAFIDDMASAYAAADLVICRAGALTVSELAAAGVASILVPLPSAVDDHQTANARHLSEHGAAYLMPQSTLSPDTLAAKLTSINRETCAQMAQQARLLALPDTVDLLIQATRPYLHEVPPSSQNQV
jgi:UDP-N-acetylglucosamine--N-acetylmuramyl-(pentapeptide) pyrophosphoryl-undecaprenol N-acetylglucosamine transferase